MDRPNIFDRFPMGIWVIDFFPNSKVHDWVKLEILTKYVYVCSCSLLFPFG